ncbi:MAG: hypothetical protein KDA96_02845 [Planctomycetaceae bacterium]|nr:hypothetical protein [Planctomycetaceae bacterium]
MSVPGLGRLVAPLLLGLSLLGNLAGAQEKVLSDRILPRKTFLYLSIPSVAQMKESFQESSAGELWADPALDDFKAEIQGAFAGELGEVKANVQEALGLTLDEVLAIPDGEVTLAVSGSSRNRLGAVLFLDFGTHEAEIKGLLDKAAAVLANADQLEREDLDHDGTELTLFNIQGPAAKATPLAKEFGWFIHDQRLVICNSRDLMTQILDNWDGSSDDSFVNNEVFAYISEKCREPDQPVLMATFFDPVGLFNELVSTGSLGQASMQASFALAFLPQFGVDQLKGFGSVSQKGSGDYEWVAKSFVYCEQPPRALMEVFQLEATDPTPPDWVKSNVSIYVGGKWKIAEAYQAIETMVDSFQGAGALEGMIDQVAQREPRVHIKHDIIEQLDGTLRMISAPAEGSSDAPYAGEQYVIALGVNDAQKWVDLLNRVTTDTNFPGEVREVEGATIYQIEQPQSNQIIAFTVAHGNLMIGIGNSLLEQVVRNNSDVRPLSDSDDYRRIADHLPGSTLVTSFSRPADQYRSLYDLLRSGNTTDMFAGMDQINRIDFTTLPEFAVIEKYMTPAGGYWVSDENGALAVQFSLKPQK